MLHSRRADCRCRRSRASSPGPRRHVGRDDRIIKSPFFCSYAAETGIGLCASVTQRQLHSVLLVSRRPSWRSLCLVMGWGLGFVLLATMYSRGSFPKKIKKKIPRPAILPKTRSVGEPDLHWEFRRPSPSMIEKKLAGGPRKRMFF